MAGETEKVTVELEVTGQQQTSAAFKNAADNVEKLDKEIKNASKSAKESQKAFDSSAKAANDNARAFENAASKAKSFSSVTGRLGSEMASLGASALSMGGSVGKAGSALSAMSRIVGGVGTGAAVGGVAGAVGGGLLSLLSEFIDTLGKTKTAEEQLAEMTAKANAEFEKQYNSVEKITQRMRDADERRRNEERRRQLSFPELAAAVTGQPTEATRQATLEADRQIQDEFEKNNAWRIGENVEAGKKGPAARGFGYRSQDDIQEQIKRLDAMARAPTLDQRADAGKEHIAKRKQEFEDLMRHHVEVSQEADAEIARSSEKSYGNMAKLGREAFAMVGESAVGLVQQIASGQKITAQNILMSLGSQLVAQGTIWLFNGDARVAESYGLDPSGYTLNAIGGAAVAAGLAMMAGSAAAGRSGGGRGGGGVSRPRAATDDPHWQVDRTGGRSQQNVNIYMPTVVSPTAQDGQRVKQALAEADRQGLAA